MSISQHNQGAHDLNMFLATNVVPVFQPTAVTDEKHCPICYEDWGNAPYRTSQLTMGVPPSINPPGSVFISAITFKAVRITHPCRHMFHGACLIQHLNSNWETQTCPMRRAVLYKGADNSAADDGVEGETRAVAYQYGDEGVDALPAPNETDESEPWWHDPESEEWDTEPWWDHPPMILRTNISVQHLQDEVEIVLQWTKDVKDDLREYAALSDDDPRRGHYEAMVTRNKARWLAKAKSLLDGPLQQYSEDSNHFRWHEMPFDILLSNLETEVEALRDRESESEDHSDSDVEKDDEMDVDDDSDSDDDNETDDAESDTNDEEEMNINNTGEDSDGDDP